MKLNFDSLRSNLSSQFDELRKVSLETDKSFIGALNAKKKTKRELMILKKLNRAEKKIMKEESIRLFTIILTRNINQERYLNFGNSTHVRDPHS